MTAPRTPARPAPGAAKVRATGTGKAKSKAKPRVTAGRSSALDRAQQFVLEYLASGNARHAAIKAGYAPRSAHVQASRLLKQVNVRAALQAAREARAKSMITTRAEIEQELRHIAFARMTRLAQWDSAGATLKSSDTLADADVAAIQEIGNTEHGPKIKLAGREGALRTLAQMLGIIEPEASQGTITVNVRRTKAAPHGKPG